MLDRDAIDAVFRATAVTRQRSDALRDDVAKVMAQTYTVRALRSLARRTSPSQSASMIARDDYASREHGHGRPTS